MTDTEVARPVLDYAASVNPGLATYRLANSSGYSGLVARMYLNPHPDITELQNRV